MASKTTEFKIDFTVHLQKSDLPSYQKATAAYAQTIPNAPLGIELRQQKPGIFIVKTFNEADSLKLENSSIIWYYGKKQDKQVKVKLNKMPKYKFYSNPKWVTIDWLNDGNLRYVRNKDLDTFLSNYGTIIEPVVEEKNEYGMLNGRRKARLDMNKGNQIERIKWVEFEVTPEEENGKVYTAKGKVKFFYQGQPVFCKRCSKDHTVKCPARIKEEEMLKVYEEKRTSECINFLATDSSLRNANEKSLFADTNVASGAKIGHTGNVLLNSDLESYKNILLSIGLNNIDPNVQTDFAKWHSQLQRECDKLKEGLTKCAAAGKQIRIVPVADSPFTKSTAHTKKMQLTINTELNNLAKKICQQYPNSVFVVQIPEDKIEEEAFTDNKHFTEGRTAKLLECIDESLPVDAKLIVRSRPKCVLLTSKIIYSEVNATYRFGCGKCTKIGHAEDTCSLNMKTTLSTKSKRGDRGSSSGEENTQNKQPR